MVNFYAEVVNSQCRLHSSSKNTPASQGVAYCDQLFHIEKEMKELSHQEKYDLRLAKSQPILDEFWQWIASYNALPGVKGGLKM